LPKLKGIPREKKSTPIISAEGSEAECEKEDKNTSKVSKSGQKKKGRRARGERGYCTEGKKSQNLINIIYIQQEWSRGGKTAKIM